MRITRNCESILGYSLIEMLVVISIVGLLMSAGVASYRQFDDRAKVDENSRIIMAELRSIQTDTNSGSSSCVSSIVHPKNTLEGKEVTMNGTPLQPIRVTDKCRDGNNVAYDGSVTTFPKDPLKVALTITVNPNTAFTFLSLNKGVDKAVTISVGNTVKTNTITITKAGGISVSQ